MATLKLGGLVSEMAGSIGGTTFKRNKTNIAVYNKPIGASKSKTWTNKALINLNDVRKIWYDMNNEEKISYIDMAKTVTFPDKYGVQRYISGYQLFTKCQNAMYLVNEKVTNASNFDKVIQPFDITDLDIDKDISTCSVSISSTNTNQYFLVSFQVNVNEINLPVFSRRKILVTKFDKNNFSIECDSEFWATYPYLKKGAGVRVYVTPLNIHGYKGFTQTRFTTVKL